MICSKVALESGVREHFTTFTEVEQTLPLDSLGISGYKDRDWWYCMLMGGPVHRAHSNV